MPPTPSTSRAIGVAAASVGLLGLLAACSPATVNASYTDGTYTADGSYQAPSGHETITVELTLVDDKVTDVTVTPHATEGNQAIFQSKFAEGIAGEVVGKDIDQLKVSRVAGSSLTSAGFNAAVTDIKSQAVEP